MYEESNEVTVKQGAMIFFSILIAVLLLRLLLGEETFIKFGMYLLNHFIFGLFHLW